MGNFMRRNSKKKREKKKIRHIAVADTTSGGVLSLLEAQLLAIFGLLHTRLNYKKICFILK